MNEHPRSATDADHVGSGKTLVNQIQDHLDSVLTSAERTLGTHNPQDGCLHCLHRELGRNEAAGIAGALGILRSTSLDTEMDLARTRLGLQ